MSYRAELTAHLNSRQTFSLSIYEQPLADVLFEAMSDYAIKHHLPAPELHRQEMVKVK